MLGTGTLRMIRECKLEGFKTPKWKNKNNILELIFAGVNHQYEGAVEGAIDGAVEGVTKGVKEKLTILLSAIAFREGNRVPAYKEITGLSDSSMERYIKILRDSELIEFRGEAAQMGGYYLTMKMKAKLK